MSRSSLSRLFLQNLCAFTLMAVIAAPPSFGLEVGEPAPAFTLPDQDGKPLSLAQNKGKVWTVLFFYPKADTPGCTSQACAFRDSHKVIEKENTVIYGISTNTPEELRAFRDKHKLNFPLLSDANGETCSAYGTKLPLIAYSKRHTFIIDPDLKIRAIDRDVEPLLDAKNVAAKIKSLQEADAKMTSKK